MFQDAFAKDGTDAGMSNFELGCRKKTRRFSQDSLT
jgi:hypothetical protein